jgi:hypothetical protein
MDGRRNTIAEKRYIENIEKTTIEKSVPLKNILL